MRLQSVVRTFMVAAMAALFAGCGLGQRDARPPVPSWYFAGVGEDGRSLVVVVQGALGGCEWASARARQALRGAIRVRVRTVEGDCPEPVSLVGVMWQVITVPIEGGVWVSPAVGIDRRSEGFSGFVPASSGLASVPRVIGLTTREACKLFSARGLRPRINSTDRDAVVIDQRPAPRLVKRYTPGREQAELVVDGKSPSARRVACSQLR